MEISPGWGKPGLRWFSALAAFDGSKKEKKLGTGFIFVYS